MTEALGQRESPKRSVCNERCAHARLWPIGFGRARSDGNGINSDTGTLTIKAAPTFSMRLFGSNASRQSNELAAMKSPGLGNELAEIFQAS